MIKTNLLKGANFDHEYTHNSLQVIVATMVELIVSGGRSQSRSFELRPEMRSNNRSPDRCGLAWRQPSLMLC